MVQETIRCVEYFRRFTTNRRNRSMIMPWHWYHYYHLVILPKSSLYFICLRRYRTTCQRYVSLNWCLDVYCCFFSFPSFISAVVGGEFAPVVWVLGDIVDSRRHATSIPQFGWEMPTDADRFDPEDQKRCELSSEHAVSGCSSISCCGQIEQGEGNLLEIGSFKLDLDL